MKVLHHLFGHLTRCKDISHLVSQRQDRDLTTFERLNVEWHLAVCKACLAFDRQMRFMHEAMRRYRE